MKIRCSQKSLLIQEYKQLIQPFVYGWCRDGIYLYIGSTNHGFRRIMTHQVIGFVEPIQDRDVFDLWFPEPEEDLFELERTLIEFHRPKWNCQGLGLGSKRNWPTTKAYARKKSFVCSACHEIFETFNRHETVCWKCRMAERKVDLNIIKTRKIEAVKLEKLPPQ